MVPVRKSLVMSAHFFYIFEYVWCYCHINRFYWGWPDNLFAVFAVRSEIYSSIYPRYKYCMSHNPEKYNDHVRGSQNFPNKMLLFMKLLWLLWLLRLWLWLHYYHNHYHYHYYYYHYHYYHYHYIIIIIILSLSLSLSLSLLSLSLSLMLLLLLLSLLLSWSSSWSWSWSSPLLSLLLLLSFR